LADELGFDRVQFRLPFLLEGNEQIAITRGYLTDLKKEMARALRTDAGIKAKSNILELIKLVTSSVFYEECKKDTLNNSRSKETKSIYYERVFPEGFSCLIGWQTAIVDMNGEVTFCYGNLQTVAGNVKSESFLEIWKGPRAKQMRSEMKHHFDLKKELWSECRQCPHLPVDGIPAKEGLMMGHLITNVP
jgi:radical SAM protein with 4Fe4S-binding SPASM domain